MADAERKETSRKPWARSARFALYAIILLAILLWTRHEKSTRDAAEAAAVEADLQQQRKENLRIQSVFSLVDDVAAAKEPAEKNRIYDEIINTYQNDTMTPVLRCVSWSWYKKGEAAADWSEKARLYETVVERYCSVPDKTVAGYVMASLRELLQHAGDGAEKIAFCDAMLTKYGSQLADSSSAWLLSEKAELVQDRAEEIALYDTILSRFLASRDDSAFDLAVIAALDKMKLVAEEEEQIRLCDIAIDAYLKTPYRTRYYLFDTALIKKAKLVGDPSLPLTLYNQVIANNVTEESVVQARSMRMPLLKDDAERLAACDDFITTHQGSESDFVQLMVVRAMMQKARLLTDSEEKMALLRTIVEKCASIKDSRAPDEANEAVALLAKLSGDSTAAAKYYDEEAAKSEDLHEALRALWSKAGLVSDQAEKIRIYDEIVAKGGDSDDWLVVREVKNALLQKVKHTDDRGEKIKLYDEVIARGKDRSDTRERAGIADAMLKKAELLDGNEAKIKLYDEVIARGTDAGNKDEMVKSAEAMLAKAKLIDDKAEKIRLYDVVLFDMGQYHNRLFLSSEFDDRLKLASDADEKLQLYDRYIAAAAGNMNPDKRIALLLDKAELMSDATDKERLYDEIIKVCERSLGVGAGGDEAAARESYTRRSIMRSFGKVILAKAALSGSVEEKLKLYEKYLAFPQPADTDFMNLSLKIILSEKAKLSGDPSLKNNYFDEKIRTAATDRERVGWYVRKADAAEMLERGGIEEEIIARFFDSTDKDVEREVARALLRRSRTIFDAAEKNELCDRLIARFQDSTDDFVQVVVVRTFALKATAADDDEKRLELYTATIERYKGVDGFPVKREVDEIIAARFRLEAAMKKGK